jgi:hypothetical protein
MRAFPRWRGRDSSRCGSPYRGLGSRVAAVKAQRLPGSFLQADSIANCNEAGVHSSFPYGVVVAKQWPIRSTPRRSIEGQYAARGVYGSTTSTQKYEHPFRLTITTSLASDA